jgi:hypothetical protein
MIALLGRPLYILPAKRFDWSGERYRKRDARQKTG